MYTLAELIKYQPQPTTSWAIYAQPDKGAFTPTCPARFGQTRFKNGGVDDGMRFFIDGKTLRHWWDRERESYIFHWAIDRKKHFRYEDNYENVWYEDALTDFFEDGHADDLVDFIIACVHENLNPPEPTVKGTDT